MGRPWPRLLRIHRTPGAGHQLRRVLNFIKDQRPKVVEQEQLWLTMGLFQVLAGVKHHTVQPRVGQLQQRDFPHLARTTDHHYRKGCKQFLQVLNGISGLHHGVI